MLGCSKTQKIHGSQRSDRNRLIRPVHRPQRRRLDPPQVPRWHGSWRALHDRGEPLRNKPILPPLAQAQQREPAKRNPNNLHGIPWRAPFQLLVVAVPELGGARVLYVNEWGFLHHQN